jgi:hypothetical protein
MEINLLYFDGCPSWKKALTHLQIASMKEKLDTQINLVEVKSALEAADVKFLGSPSFQINGQDLWPEDRQSYSMNCRVYKTNEGLKGWPTIEMLRQKLLETIQNKEMKK